MTYFPPYKKCTAFEESGRITYSDRASDFRVIKCSSPVCPNDLLVEPDPKWENNVRAVPFETVKRGCPSCGGLLYVEDNERYSGEEDAYVVMCFDCGWMDEYAYEYFCNAEKRLRRLNESRAT